jgi:hypothetical protein
MTLLADDMFEKVWKEMAQYLSDHARGLVDMKEIDRTVLCNSALNAALRLDEVQEHLGRGREKFAQMREYMRAHSVVHDAVGYTLLVRVAKQELDEAVRETELLANRTRQQQREEVTRAERAAATAAAAAAERRAALALRNLLNLWTTLGLADARVQAAGKSSMLDSRLTNGLLAALASAARLVDVDPLALTASVGANERHVGADHDANKGYRQQRDGNSADDEQQVEPEIDASCLDFELGYDFDDSSPEPFHVAEQHDNDSDDDDGDEDYDDDDNDDEDRSFDHQSTRDDESDSEDSSGRWVPRSGFGEERRARQRKAIVAMSWQLWSALQLQIGARATAGATHSDGGGKDTERESPTGRDRKQSARHEAREKQEERKGVTHVLSTLTSVMLRAGDADDQG